MKSLGLGESCSRLSDVMITSASGGNTTTGGNDASNRDLSRFLAGSNSSSCSARKSRLHEMFDEDPVLASTFIDLPGYHRIHDYQHVISNDDSILDITMTLNDLRIPATNNVNIGRVNSSAMGSSTQPAPNLAAHGESNEIQPQQLNPLGQSHLIPISKIRSVPASTTRLLSNEVEEIVEIPEDLMMRIELAKRDFENELAEKRATALVALETALQEGAASYLEELTQKLESMKFNEKYQLPISKEHEHRRKVLLSAISRAVVQEGKDLFHCADYVVVPDADLGISANIISKEVRGSAYDSGKSYTLPEECHRQILDCIETVKSRRLQSLEGEIQNESSSRVAEIDGHIKFREQHWINKTQADTVKAYNAKVSAYVAQRKKEVKENVDRLRKQLEESSFMDLARGKATEAMIKFSEQVAILKATTVDALIETAAFCSQNSSADDSSDFNVVSPKRVRTEPTSPISGTRHNNLPVLSLDRQLNDFSQSTLADNQSDVIYIQMQRLQKILIATDLAKRRLNALDR
jgi:hypothetical protein